MSKEDWTSIEKSLSWTGSRVVFDCDGYRLSIYRQRYKDLRDCFFVYVDGVWKGEWRSEDCEERRRFACPKKAFLHRPKERAEIKKSRAKMRKSDLKWLQEKYKDVKWFDPDSYITYYTPIWMSFKLLKAHLIKNNKQIRLLKPEEETISGEIKS